MDIAQVSKILNVPITDDLFRSVSEETREMLLLQAQTISEIAPTWHESIPKKILMKSMLRRGKMYAPRAVLDQVIEGRSFELWDSNMKLIGCCWKIFKMTSFSTEEMLTRDWSKLLRRAPEEVGRIFHALASVRATGQTLIDVCPPHRVEELKFNGSVHEVILHALGPIYRDDTHEFCGYAAVTTLRPLLN